MVKFCSECNNLLIPNYKNDELKFQCYMCKIEYLPDDKDTLIYEKIKKSDIMIFEKILNRAGDDPATIKEIIQCIKKNCKNNIVKQVRLGDEMKLFNICTVCKTQWLN